jgi:hypothetical protein
MRLTDEDAQVIALSGVKQAPLRAEGTDEGNWQVAALCVSVIMNQAAERTTTSISLETALSLAREAASTAATV